jgi:outer membrane protein OmpA-like peptidoglycan-associated protein
MGNQAFQELITSQDRTLDGAAVNREWTALATAAAKYDLGTAMPAAARDETMTAVGSRGDVGGDNDRVARALARAVSARKLADVSDVHEAALRPQADETISTGARDCVVAQTTHMGASNVLARKDGEAADAGPGDATRDTQGPGSGDEGTQLAEPGPTAASPLPSRSRSSTPESCPSPSGMPCPEATSSPGSVTNTLIFPADSAHLNPLQKAEVDATAAAWNAMATSVTVRVDGYASAEGACIYNWGLSCRRASAVAAQLASPTDGSAGVSPANVETFAHGESNDAGAALAPNRRATISIPVSPTPPPTPPAPSACLPHLLGSARGCGSGDDFAHHDFPGTSISSDLKMSAWAAAHPGSRFSRSDITDAECEIEMAGVLGALAGADGSAAFGRFVAGTGGTSTHGPTSSLGSMALAAPSFLAAVRTVQRAVEAQLAAQVASGSLDPCTLSIVPPATHFQTSDGLALKAVIGGTQGEQLFVTSFIGSAPTRTYTIGLRFVICDDFGVDESDIYAPGLIPFWVLQHERGTGTNYAPFIDQLDLPVVLSGTF